MVVDSSGTVIVWHDEGAAGLWWTPFDALGLGLRVQDRCPTGYLPMTDEPGFYWDVSLADGDGDVVLMGGVADTLEAAKAAAEADLKARS